MFCLDHLPLACGVIFAAAFVRSAFGFGDALVAMPLLAIVLRLGTATPLVALISTTMGGLILSQDWRVIDFRSALRLIVAAVFGIPLGLAVPSLVDEAYIKALLAFLILFFSSFVLLQPGLTKLNSDKPSYAFGFLAGVLGGAYNTPGPALVVYGSMRGWSPIEFRATLQAYFFPTSLLILGGHTVLGRINSEVLGYYCVSLPPVLAAIVLGRMLNRRFRLDTFVRLIHAGLILIAVALLYDSLNSFAASEAP